MSAEEKPVYEFGPFRLDAAERLLLRDGDPVPLTPKVFHTLEALVRRSGRLVEKDELLREIWPDSFVEEANLSMNVSAVRRALGEEPGEDRYIETVPKRGYRFVAEVRVVSNGRSRGNGNGNGSYAAVAVVPDEAEALREVAPAPVEAPAEPESAPRPARTRAVTALGVAALVAATAAAVLGVSARYGRAVPAFDFQKMQMAKLAGTGRSVAAVVSPDGKYLAEVIDADGRASLSIRQMATTRTVEIVPPADVIYDGVSFSPDSTFIYYTTDGTEGPAAYRIPALGGRPARVATGVDRAVGVSPDGSRIAFVRIDYDTSKSALVVAALDGSDERPLYVISDTETLLFGNAAWSPDGKHVVCMKTDGAIQTVLSLLDVSVDDGSVREIGSSRWKVVERVCWLPDGSGLLLSALPKDSMGQPFQIWSVDYPGGEVRRVTNDLSSYVGVSLTADGSRLVSTQSKSQSYFAVLSPNDHGAVARRLAPGSSTLDGVQGICWAPGGRIVYMTWGSGNADIWSMNADGTGVVQLTDDGYREYWPDVTRDGRYIVYASNHGSGPAIWRVEVDGGTPTRLTSGATDGHPMCAPDGWVYFTRRSGERFALCKVPVAGGDVVELFEARFQSPALSPDGTMIADLHSVEGSAGCEIRIVSAADGRELMAFPARPINPWSGVRWSPDGRGIAYVSRRDGLTNVWLQPVNGAAPKQITGASNDDVVNAAWSPDGRALACTRVTASSVGVTITNFRP